MIYLGFLILVTLILIMLKRKQSLFHPSKAYPYFLLIYVLPYVILFLIHENEILNDYSVKLVASESIGLLTYFTLLTSLSLLSYNLGVSFILNKTRPFQQRNKSSTINVNSIILFCLFFALVFFYVFFNSVGGILYYIQNISNRSQLALGNNYYSQVYIFFLFFGSFLSVYSLQKNNLSKFKFYLIIILSICLIIVSGSRSMIIRYFLVLITSSYFIYKPTFTQIFSFKNRMKMGLMFLILSIYIVIVPIVRNSTISGEINFKDSLSEAGGQIEELAKGNLYTEIQLNILKIFEKRQFWYGRSYFDLLTAPIPRSILPQKASSDDGIYIFNMVYGREFDLGGDFDKLILNSWPPSTFGIGYANFGEFGVLVWFFLLGIIIAYAYKLMDSKKSLVYLFIYCYVFWRLHLSNLLILEVLTIIVLTYIIILLFPKVKTITY